MRKTLLIIFIVAVLVGVFWYAYGENIVRYFFFAPRQPVSLEENVEETPFSNSVELENGVGADVRVEPVTVVATDLAIPWGIAFLPSGDMLVTERPGQLVRIDGEGSRHDIALDIVVHAGEGGLLGIALHPELEENRWLYLYFTTQNAPSETVNRVVRYRYENDTLTDRVTIVDNIPSALFHNGGQLAFGPDGYLYITTGDATDPNLAQDVSSLAGKILRVGESGETPNDNPFNNLVWSYGHRNPQGLAWDPLDNLWSTEHGRSGVLSGLDELNLIERGGNYGWPESQGDTVHSGTIAPILHSGPDITWAPASLAYLNDTLYFGGLRGETLYAYRIGTGELSGHFFGQFGRIRAVVVGPDNVLYITTSNRDGRGEVREGDDKIIRIDPSQL